MGSFGTVVVVILVVAFYLLPTFIAERRGAAHATGIFLVNLLFGWTILGWIAALIWAFVEQPQGQIHLTAENAKHA